MTIERLNHNTGKYELDPDYHNPPDLVTVYDVFGQRYRVRQRHLDDGRRMIRTYNQYGNVIRHEGGDFDGCLRVIHRDNLQPQA